MGKRFLSVAATAALLSIPALAGNIVLTGLARRYLSAGKRDEARQALAAAIAANPRFTQASLSLAQMDVYDNKLDAARQRLSTILKSEPTNTAALFLLGNVDDLSGHRDAAIAGYRKIVQLDRGNLPALNNLAFHLADDPKTAAEALSYAQHAVELAPDNPEMRDTLGWAYYQAGMYPDAVKQFESATAKGGPPQWKYHLAMAYAKIGDLQRATKIVSVLAAKNHDLPEAKMAEHLLVESAQNR
jgi:tetratricopeptide (TPR) repeat protein